MFEPKEEKQNININDKIKEPSNIYDTMIDRAIADVQNAFSNGTSGHIKNMLIKLSIVTAKLDIMNFTENFIEKCEKEARCMNTRTPYTYADGAFHALHIDSWRISRYYELFKNIILMLEEKEAFRNRHSYGADVNREMADL